MNIEVGSIVTALTTLTAFIAGAEFITVRLKKVSQDWVKEMTDPINNKLDDLYKKIDEVDMDSTKDFVVGYLADIKRGVEKSEIEKERFYERSAHYFNNGGNTYVKSEYEELKSQKKI